MTVGVGLYAAVERLHFLFGCQLVASRLLLHQVHAVEEEVGGQQEARQREDEQAHVDLGGVGKGRGRGIVLVTFTTAVFRMKGNE